jgi:hypothetical protein
MSIIEFWVAFLDDGFLGVWEWEAFPTGAQHQCQDKLGVGGEQQW